MFNLRKRIKKVQGIGINDVEYPVHKFSYKTNENGNKVVDKRLWTCPYYATWEGMLRRCYSKRVKSIRVTYEEVEVCEEWLAFSNFRRWMEKQTWDGLDLDKDFLSSDAKCYSPETCVFIPKSLNQFLKDRSNDRGDYLLGVDKKPSGFQARVSNPFTKQREYLGFFKSEYGAHEAWRKRKNELANEWAVLLQEQGYDDRLIQVLRSRYART